MRVVVAALHVAAAAAFAAPSAPSRGTRLLASPNAVELQLTPTLSVPRVLAGCLRLPSQKTRAGSAHSDEATLDALRKEGLSGFDTGNSYVRLRR